MYNKRRLCKDPDVEPDSLVPVSWFQGSRHASGSSPSPYQNRSKTQYRGQKVAHLSSRSSVGVSIVEVKSNFEGDICSL